MSNLPNEAEARKLGEALGWTEMMFHYINITSKPIVMEENRFTSTSQFRLLECYGELLRIEGSRIGTENIRFFEDGVQVMKGSQKISLSEMERDYQPVINYLKLKGLNLN